MYGVLVDRRRSKRFPVQVPITIWDVGGRPEISGLTRDISSGGVFFLVDFWPRGGRPFQFMFTLPASGSGQLGEIPVFCEGKTVRVEKHGLRQFGVAVAISRYQLGRARGFSLDQVS